MKNSLLIFAVVLGTLCNTIAADAPAGHKRVGVDAFAKLLKEKKLTVLDVRTEDEYDEGHIKNAVNINYYADDFKKRVGKLDKSKAYLLHCRSGGRSGRAGKIMIELGFKLIYDLAPGMNGWQAAGKPVVTK
jgi:phage shock protein E